MSNQSKRRLEAAVQAIQQKWGPQALHKGALPAARSAVATLPTALPHLDRILPAGDRPGGQGGLPLGHISELIGQPTSGKRTLALSILAQAQRRYAGIYVDLAQTFDPAYAAACHVDLSRLVIAVPPTPAHALDLLCDLATGGHFGLIVFDSTAELLTVSSPPATLAAVLRRLRHVLEGKACALLLLTTPSFGEPGASTNYPAGFDLEQAAALRLLIDRQRWLRRPDRSIGGYEAQITVLRSRWSAPGRQAKVRISFNGVRVEDGVKRET